jgi:hypothetical protein
VLVLVLVLVRPRPLATSTSAGSRSGDAWPERHSQCDELQSPTGETHRDTADDETQGSGVLGAPYLFVALLPVLIQIRKYILPETLENIGPACLTSV